MAVHAALDINAERLNAARFSYSYAHEHCQQYPDNKSCAWYHGSWQFLRLLELVSTPAVHASHFDTQLKKIADDSSYKNILISGSADSALVQTIHEALAHRQAELKLSVVDICATPLKVCEQYAKKNNLEINILKQNVLEGLQSNAFDAIFTHSFMGYFDDANRELLLRQWANALRTGGRLITVQRIRENHTKDIVRFDADEVEAFVARATELVQQPDASMLAQFDIVAMAKNFAGSFQNFPVRSAEKLRAMFETAGFKLTVFERQATQGTAGVTGPSVPNATGFYLIAAERL